MLSFVTQNEQVPLIVFFFFSFFFQSDNFQAHVENFTGRYEI